MKQTDSRLYSWGQRNSWALALIVSVIVFAASYAFFAPTLQFEFLDWDDDIAITKNPLIHTLNWESFLHFFTDKEVVSRFMPFSFLTWAVLQQWFGLDPYYYHFANVFFHSLAAFSLFFLLLELLEMSSERLRDDTKPSPRIANTFFAAAASLLWALHPLRVEVVARASNLTYCAATFFLFMSAYTYLRHLNQGKHETRELRLSAGLNYWASVLCLASSLLYFGLGLSFIGILLLFDFCFYPKFQGETFTHELRQRLYRLSPFIALTLLAAGFNFSAHFFPEGAWKELESHKIVAWYLQIGRASLLAIYYLLKNFLPTNLMPANPFLIYLQFHDWQIWASVLIVALALFVAWIFRGRFKRLFLLTIAYFILLIPTLTVTVDRLPFPCDRYSQLLSVVWAFGVIEFARWLAAQTKTHGLRFFGGLFLICLPLTYGAVSLPLAQAWESSVTLFEYSIMQLKNDPYRYDFYPRLANAYMNQGKVQLAVPLLIETLRVTQNPNPALLSSLGNAHLLQGQWADAEKVFQRLVEKLPRFENFRALVFAQSQLGKAGAAKATIERALASGIISEEEREELTRTLRSILQQEK